MRRLALLLIIVAVPLAVAAAAVANTTQTEVVTVHDTFDFGEAAEACGFPVDLRVDGSFKITDYFDNSGTLFKEIITAFGGPFTLTAINPANHKSTTTQTQSFATFVRFNPDGSVASASSSGPTYNFVVPGLGTILQSTGRLVFDGDSNIVFTAGPHDFDSGNTAALCNYLADP